MNKTLPVKRGQQMLAEFTIPANILPDRRSITKEVMPVHADEMAPHCPT
jgi:hypothetical protein